MTHMTNLDKSLGAIVGLAVGDQLGCLVEGKSPGSFDRIRDMPDGSFWTDDTAQALCLTDSLISIQGFDLDDQLNRYADWLYEGYMSCKEWAYGCGPTARLAITRYRENGLPAPVKDQSTNGALMRLAPVPVFYSADLKRGVEMSGESAKSTHDNVICIDACRLYGSMIIKALNGAGKEKVLAYEQTLWTDRPLDPAIVSVASGSYIDRDPPDIKGTLDIVDSIEAALWAFDRTSSFGEGALKAVNLGDDADTTAAIYGQLAGAFYGYSSIPQSWKRSLVDRALIEYLGTKLHEVRFEG